MLPSLKGVVGTTLSTVFAGFAAHRTVRGTSGMLTPTAPSAVARETLKAWHRISLRFLFIEERSLLFSLLRELARAVYRNRDRLSDPFLGTGGTTIARIGFRARRLERRREI